MSNARTGNSPVPDRSDLERVRNLPDEHIGFDAEAPRTRPEDWEGATIRKAGNVVGQVPKKRRGPGKKQARVLTALRLPADVLERWKASGPGWQSRIAELLAKQAP